MKKAAKQSLSFFKRHLILIVACGVVLVATLIVIIVFTGNFWLVIDHSAATDELIRPVRTLNAREKPSLSPPRAETEAVAPTSADLNKSTTFNAAIKDPSSAIAGSLAEIAASYSMTIAKVASLPMPPSEILKGADASKFIKNSWPWMKGGSDFLSFRKDPFDSSGDSVFSIEYPKDSSAGSATSGGVGSLHLGVFGSSKAIKRAIISYEVAFEKDFDFVKGGKLPGGYGGEQTEGCTGGDQSAACFSLRLMWREKGAGEVYAYIPRYDALCKDNDEALCNDVYGGKDELPLSSWNDQLTSEWDCLGLQSVSIVVAGHSPPGRDPSSSAQFFSRHKRSGQWSDGHLVYRINSTVTFSSFLISSFFGGSTGDFASKGGRSFFRHFEFYSGEKESDVDGDEVSAQLATGKN
ncbi:hypothetical protein OIO90_003238 [Microbotryomycetes sp. JL221]|nr:hypothetical protein OIO90_003238 [Microbotryomycetes sp. JL221]